MLGWTTKMYQVIESLGPHSIPEQGPHSSTAQSWTPSFSRLLRRLQHYCRLSGRTPSSCELREEITLVNPIAIGRTAISDVFQGRAGDLLIAVKVPRMTGGKMATVKRVGGSTDPVTSSKSTESATKTLYNEAVVWKHLRHPHIVSFVGVSMYGGISLISEWMTHGTIMTFLGDHPKANRLKYVRFLCV